jgi:hypothetical protein
LDPPLNSLVQAFVSHFRNYQPRRLRFFYHTTPVKASNWSKYFRLAARPQKKLVLDLHLK